MTFKEIEKNFKDYLESKNDDMPLSEDRVDVIIPNMGSKFIDKNHHIAASVYMPAIPYLDNGKPAADYDQRIMHIVFSRCTNSNYLKNHPQEKDIDDYLEIDFCESTDPTGRGVFIHGFGDDKKLYRCNYNDYIDEAIIPDMFTRATVSEFVEYLRRETRK